MNKTIGELIRFVNEDLAEGGWKDLGSAEKYIDHGKDLLERSELDLTEVKQLLEELYLAAISEYN